MIVADDLPFLYLVYRKNAMAVSKKVQGIKVVDLLGHNGAYADWTVTN